MKAIGLTGGIGSGKSTVARMLQQMGYPVYIADTEASRLLHDDPEIRLDLEKRFGEQVYTPEGNMNKPLVARLVFNDPQALADINSIVHPRVMRNFQTWCERQDGELVFFESAILFEANLQAFFQYVICVTAPEEARIARVIARDHTTADKVQARIRNQLDDTLKRRKADFTIHNASSDMVTEQLLDILKQLDK